MSKSERAAHFRALHHRPQQPLVLPNAWDAASARVIELAGAEAIATTSAGVSWTHGRGDGQRLTRDEMLAAIGHIARTVRVPVSADIEGGYGSGSPFDVAETVSSLVALGVAGCNLEDSPGVGSVPLLSIDAQSARIRAARGAGGDIVINARIDVFMFGVGAPETRFDETVARARAFVTSGADSIFVPGVVDVETIGALVRAIDAPLNVMAMPGAPDVATLASLGVARVSVGPTLAQAALAATRRVAREMLERGTYGAPEDGLPFGEVNGMF